MVQILAPLFGAVLLFSSVMAAPMPDSSINEPAVSSPNGIPITEGAAVGTPNVAAYQPAATTTAAMAEASSSSAKMMEESSSAKMMAESSSAKMMSEATSTKQMVEATSTAAATSTQYGSGSSGNSGYDSCVMQCMNTYGAPSAQYTPPPSKSSDSGSSGGGATHTVIVAPTKGVLRFVPFTLNATVGDTIHYVWGAGPHTVTKGSQLEPCNKSTDAATFTSGPQNATFTFDEKVTDTNPLFFFCNVPGHCAKGMFGIVNAPNAAPTVATTVAQMMPQWIANSSVMASANAYVVNKTMGTSAFSWGDNLDVASIPTWAHAAFAENVMYTRLMYAANPGMLEAGVGAGYPDGKPFTRPSDAFDILLNNLATGAAPAANAQSPSSSSASSDSAPSASAAAPSASTTGKKSGAASVASSSALLVGVIAVAATFFAL